MPLHNPLYRVVGTRIDSGYIVVVERNLLTGRYRTRAIDTENRDND